MRPVLRHSRFFSVHPSLFLRGFRHFFRALLFLHGHVLWAGPALSVTEDAGRVPLLIAEILVVEQELRYLSLAELGGTGAAAGTINKFSSFPHTKKGNLGSDSGRGRKWEEETKYSVFV